MEKDFWTQSLIESEITISKRVWSWKFPFIRKVNLMGDILRFKKIINQHLNQILDNQEKSNFPSKPYDSNSGKN